MLVLDFINVGNGDSILVQELEGGARRFAMLVDCGHDSLVRDDHPGELDPRSQRIYAGDFLKKQGIDRLDVLLATHFHRDHIGGLGRVLEAAAVDELAHKLPLELQADFQAVLQPEPSEEEELVHIADKLCAYLKCAEELNCGNQEFGVAYKASAEKMQKYAARPEVAYFMEHFVPSFSLTLDELKK